LVGLVFGQEDRAGEGKRGEKKTGPKRGGRGWGSVGITWGREKEKNTGKKSGLGGSVASRESGEERGGGQGDEKEVEIPWGRKWK